MFKFLLKNKLKTPEELDNLYEILDYQNSWVEIRRKDDSSLSKNEEKLMFIVSRTGLKSSVLNKKFH